MLGLTLLFIERQFTNPKKAAFMKKLHLAFALGISIALQACASSTPEKLANDLQTALGKGDIDAALALGNFKVTLPDLRWFYLKQVVSCGYESVCSVSVKADDPAAIAERQAQQLKQGFEFEAEPAGVLVLSIVSRKPGAFKGEQSMPYAKIDGQYRILTGQYSAKKLAELRAQTNVQLLDVMFAQGIRENAPPHKNRTDWKTAATVLPAGGGEIGAAYAAEVARDYLHYSSGDLAGVLADGGAFEKTLYGEKDFDGTPVAKSVRLSQLRAQSGRMTEQVKVLGGYQLGDDVVLDTEGKADNGWVVRGPILLTQDSDGKYIPAGDMTVSYPE